MKEEIEPGYRRLYVAFENVTGEPDYAGDSFEDVEVQIAGMQESYTIVGPWAKLAEASAQMPSVAQLDQDLAAAATHFLDELVKVQKKDGIRMREYTALTQLLRETYWRDRAPAPSSGEADELIAASVEFILWRESRSNSTVPFMRWVRAVKHYMSPEQIERLDAASSSPFTSDGGGK